MKRIRDAQTIVGMLEGGELNAALSSEITETPSKLKTMSEENHRKTFKGSVTLKIGFEMEAGAVTISADIDAKTPKQPRARSFYWVTDDGSLSTEHPQQTDMFAGPRDVSANA